jgi:hypothetical protein
VPFGEGGDRLPHAALSEAAGGMLPERNSLVFLNACTSGVPPASAADKHLPPDQMGGFAKVFLRAGTTGVIGTLGRVHAVHAARVARDLLVAARARPDVPVAVLLRDLRRAALRRRLEARGDAKAVQYWLCAFSYAWYGDPAVSLRLVP